MKDKNEIRVKVHRLVRTAGDPPTAEQRAQIDALDWILGDADPILDDESLIPDSDENIRKAITLLKASKDQYPQYSAFGDPNWRIADAQVEILEWVLSTDR